MEKVHKTHRFENRRRTHRLLKKEKAQLSLTNPRDAKACQNCSNSTCSQRCRWQYWPIFIRLAVVASKICEIPQNSLKIQTYRVQGHPRSSILVSMESPYVTSYLSLIVTLAVSATVFEIFTLKDRKLLILPTHPCLTPPSGETPWYIDVIYTRLKSAFNGLQFRCWHYRTIFIRLAVVASQSREIRRNSDIIWPYSSSRWSKVIDLGVNRKPMYDFLLVINSNFGPIC